MRCDRCGKETKSFTMSMFNTQMICHNCETREMNHKDYEKARQADREQVLKGNYNFEGIGMPIDL